MSKGAGICSDRVSRLVGGLLIGADLVIDRPCSLGCLKDRGLTFSRTSLSAQTTLTDSRLRITVLAPFGTGAIAGVTVIEVADPRSSFAKVITEFFVAPALPGIAATAKISGSAEIAKSATIGEYCVIGDNARIGAGTVIRNHVVVAQNCSIGKHCLIKSHVVIGEEGFGIAKDPAGNNFRLPHIGGVEIGDYVELGAFNTVCSGTIDPTVVGSYVKTDDHVHIAHNCRIGKNTLLTAHVMLAGSVTVGADVWIAPNASILNKISIGDGAFIGLGAVVLKDCEAGASYAGVPARRLPKKAD